MYIVPRLDIMIAYSCNLACAGCISLSDRKRDGIASYEEIQSWIVQWKEKISPDVISIFGGEPCLHPKLIDICKLIRINWPGSTIRLITNGYLLDQFQSNSWFDFAPFEIQISVHRKDHEPVINQKIKEILVHKKDWKVKKYGGADHKQIEWCTSGVKIYKSIFKDFVTPYKQDNSKIMPWNSDPSQSHKICGSPSTPILYKGKLYKCPPVANIIDLTEEIYENYQGYGINDNLEEFIYNIGKPESICGFCPNKNQAVIVDHSKIQNVTVKQKISY